MTWFTIALLSALISAASTITEKKILFKLEALEFSFILSVFNMLLSLPFLYFTDFGNLSQTGLLILYFKTILGSLAFLNVMLALKNLELSGALPLMVLTPGFVAVFAAIFLGDSLSPLAIAGLFLLVLGTYVLELKAGKKILDPFKIFVKSEKHHYIVYALAFFTATAVIDKMLLKDYKFTPNSMMAFQQIFFFLNFLLMILFSRKKPVQVFRQCDRAYLALVVLVAFLTIGYRYTLFEAMKIAPVALVLAIKRTSVFFAAVVGGNLFKESDLSRKIIASAILVLGAIILTLKF